VDSVVRSGEIRKTPAPDTKEARVETAPRAAGGKAETASAGPNKYLNIFWNQHQPYYKDEAADCFTQPWVRLHATKDYYSMAAVLDRYPNVHVTINLSSSLLRQLDEYQEKLYDFADIGSPHYGNAAFYPEGHVDRFMDLTLKPVENWSKDDRKFALDRFFDADFKGQIGCFPGYKYLYEKRGRGEAFSDQDFRDLKAWFNLVWMDHSFQSGDVEMLGDALNGKPMEPPEKVSSIDDLMKKGAHGGYGNSGFTEEDCKAIALEQYRIIKYVVPVHRRMQNRISPDGNPQVEVVTTPFYHPILPLINDLGSAASEANPGMPLPERKMAAPEDAEAQVAKGAEYYKKAFGSYPKGMWPGEGAVSEAVVGAFQKNGIRWIATGNEVAGRSGHFGDNGLMYRIDTDKTYLDHDGPGGSTDNSDAMSIIFRSMHDHIGFDYGAHQGRLDGIDAARDFVNNVKAWQHWNGVPGSEDILVTNMADGENCWTQYTNNGSDFLEALYGLLDQGKTGIRTTTPSAFAREHPVDRQWELEPLAAGTWVGGDFSTWVGEPTENDAWNRLQMTRESLVAAGVPRPNPRSICPDPARDRKKFFEWKAWEALYAAEGSDWFWWYGNDQGDNSKADASFADNQRNHMVNAYVFARQAGYEMKYPAWVRPGLDASGRTVQVPPLTANPWADPPATAADGKHPVRLSLDVFMPREDPGKVGEVTIDLTPIGGKKTVPLLRDEEGRYFVKTPVDPGTDAGLKLLKVTARSDGNVSSFDYIPLKVMKDWTTRMEEYFAPQ
jgi:alpha-amylase/alpha-mannosidase (GH57 family)